MTDKEKLDAIAKIKNRMYMEWNSYQKQGMGETSLEGISRMFPKVMKSLSNGFLDIDEIIRYEELNNNK